MEAKNGGDGDVVTGIGRFTATAGTVRCATGSVGKGRELRQGAEVWGTEGDRGKEQQVAQCRHDEDDKEDATVGRLFEAHVAVEARWGVNITPCVALHAGGVGRRGQREENPRSTSSDSRNAYRICNSHRAWGDAQGPDFSNPWHVARHDTLSGGRVVVRRSRIFHSALL